MATKFPNEFLVVIKKKMYVYLVKLILAVFNHTNKKI